MHGKLFEVLDSATGEVLSSSLSGECTIVVGNDKDAKFVIRSEGYAPQHMTVLKRDNFNITTTVALKKE